MRHDTGIEQRRRFERILVKKIGADQLALDFGKTAMRRESLLHLVGTELERFQQVAMTALEVIQHVRQLAGRSLRIKRENALDDMVGARLVGRVEIARFGRRLERADDDARRVGTQIERLAVQEGGLQQRALGSLEAGKNQAPMARSATGFVGLTLTRAS